MKILCFILVFAIGYWCGKYFGLAKIRADLVDIIRDLKIFKKNLDSSKEDKEKRSDRKIN